MRERWQGGFRALLRDKTKETLHQRALENIGISPGLSYRVHSRGPEIV